MTEEEAMAIERFIIKIYCLIDGELNKVISIEKLRKRRLNPSFVDNKTSTLETVAEF